MLIPSTSEPIRVEQGLWISVLRTLAPALEAAINNPGSPVACPVHGDVCLFHLRADEPLTGAAYCQGSGNISNGYELLSWLKSWSLEQARREVGRVSLGSAHPDGFSLNQDASCRAILEGSRPDPGPVSQYLRSLGLSGVVRPMIQFIPSVDLRVNGNGCGVSQAMVAPIKDGADKILGLLITQLGVANGRRQFVVPEICTGGAVQLSSPRKVLAVVSGLEDALAVMEATSTPTWAAPRYRDLSDIPIPPGVEEVEIWGDYLPRWGDHEISVHALARRLRRDGVKVRLIPSSQEHTSWCDMLAQDGPKSLLRARHSAEDIPGVSRETPAPPFPMWTLPIQLSEFVRAASAALRCPPDFLGVPLLVLAGAAIGNSRVLELKRGYVVGANMYAALVANPGSAKSPALSVAADPFYRRQEEAHLNYTRALVDHQKKVAEYEKAQKSAGRGAKPNAELNEPPAEPPAQPALEYLWTSDVTIEALAMLLQSSHRGMVIIRDELSGWVRSLGQYKGGRGADREFFLETWSQKPINSVRKGQPELLVHRPFLSIIGAITPDMVGTLAEDDGREDGFVDRILFSFPEPVSKRWTEDSISESVKAAYVGTFERLWKLAPAVSSSGQRSPIVLNLRPEARSVWAERVNALYDEAEHPDFPNLLRGSWAKMEVYAGRLALIIHLLRYVHDDARDENVDEVSVSSGWALIDYFKSHQKRVLRHLRADPTDRKVDSAIRWIRRRGGECTVRDLTRYEVAGIKGSQDARKLISDLVDRGYGRFKSKGKTEVFCLDSTTL